MNYSIVYDRFIAFQKAIFDYLNALRSLETCPIVNPKLKVYTLGNSKTIRVEDFFLNLYEIKSFIVETQEDTVQIVDLIQILLHPFDWNYQLTDELKMAFQRFEREKSSFLAYIIDTFFMIYDYTFQAILLNNESFTKYAKVLSLELGNSLFDSKFKVVHFYFPHSDYTYSEVFSEIYILNLFSMYKPAEKSHMDNLVLSQFHNRNDFKFYQ